MLVHSECGVPSHEVDILQDQLRVTLRVDDGSDAPDGAEVAAAETLEVLDDLLQRVADPRADRTPAAPNPKADNFSIADFFTPDFVSL